MKYSGQKQNEMGELKKRHFWEQERFSLYEVMLVVWGHW